MSMAPLLMTLTPNEIGILFGLIHHFVIQYPSQADVFTTLFAFIVSNVLYAILWVIAKDPSGKCTIYFQDILVFNSVFVRAM